MSEIRDALAEIESILLSNCTGEDYISFRKWCVLKKRIFDLLEFARGMNGEPPLKDWREYLFSRRK